MSKCTMHVTIHSVSCYRITESKHVKKKSFKRKASGSNVLILHNGRTTFLFFKSCFSSSIICPRPFFFGVSKAK